MEFYIHVNTYFYIELKYFFSIYTEKQVLTIVSRLVQMTKCEATRHGTRRFFIGTLAIFFVQ